MWVGITIPECPRTREFLVHLLLDIHISFSCVTSIPDTFTAWLCQGGHFLCVVSHWRELSLCLRQPGGAKQHLSFAHFRVSKPGNYLVLLTCYSVFTSTVTEGFLV